MIKIIYFDIGGVVTHTDFLALYRNFAERVGIAPEFVEQYHKDNWRGMLLGSITLEQFFQDMKNAGASDAQDLQAVWQEEGIKLRRVDNELLGIIASLRKRYRVAVLSNLTPTRLIMDEAMDLYSHFDFAVLSCKEGFRKPDPQFYHAALQRGGVQPAEAVLVDDREDNVAAARDMGLVGILFNDTNKFAEDLKKLTINLA